MDRCAKSRGGRRCIYPEGHGQSHRWEVLAEEEVMDMEIRRLVPAGYRCWECGRLDAESNQPCTEHGGVEQVYRVVGSDFKGD